MEAGLGLNATGAWGAPPTFAAAGEEGGVAATGAGDVTGGEGGDGVRAAGGD